MVAVMEQKNPPMEEEQHHYRFIPLTGDNIYNCELCGIRIAVLHIVTSGTCLKEYIDQQAAAKK